MSEAIERERLRAALPPGHGYRRRRAQVGGRLLDLAISARQAALGLGRELDVTGSEQPLRGVLVLGIYGPRGEEPIGEAVRQLRRSRHEVRVVLGALGPPAPGLEAETLFSGMEGGKFANLNRLAEAAAPLAADWLLVLDDDVALSRRFLDRLVHAAEALRFDLAQPALSRASHAAWEVNRRRPDLARQTGLVEIGPALLISRRAWRELTPFPEAGMGWGLCLHWAALAESRGWRLGVIDAVPIRHESRPPAEGYGREAAAEAAIDLLGSREHLTHEEAGRTLATYSGLP
ncbi:MAG: hypothetical protein EXQ70_09210 [Solirubrobacterales bacterium]|nr:hypothetical protein [Solirubrobacterales bacterium]